MSKKQKDPTKNKVALIEDPFRIPTLEIASAQDSDDVELDAASDDLEDTDEDIAEDSEDSDEFDGLEKEAEIPDSTSQLESLARAIQNAEEISVQEAEEAVNEAQGSAERLAREIAEDQALAQEMARAAEESENETDPELQAAMPAMDVAEVASAIEALLFISDKPISMNKLREFLGPDFGPEVFHDAIALMKERYASPSQGIELVQIAGGLQLRTKPGRAALLKKLAKVQTQRLSSGAMESLAIIAYRQPVMKEDIDKIRGVDSSYFIHGLLEKKLIKISGRSELPGRPMLYETADEFLHLFGLNDLQSLPPLRELEQMIPSSEGGNAEDEDPRVKEMRKLVSQMKSDESTSLVYNPREDEQLLQDIRERVQSIPISTPYLEEQKALEKAAQALQEVREAGQAEGQSENAEAVAAEALAAEASPEAPSSN